MSTCPICRSVTDMFAEDGRSTETQDTSVLTGGILTRFLHTYFGQESLESSDQPRARAGMEWNLKSKQSDDEMQTAVSELVRAVLGEVGWQRSTHHDIDKASSDGSNSPCSPALVPDDFFKTLPTKIPMDLQTLATQKLVWLQQASSTDPLAFLDSMVCTLCSEMLCVDAVVTTPCKHHFHRVCVSRLQMPQCPLCSGPLPYSWFLPAGHTLGECGFHVVSPQEYNPPFPGGPNLDSGGFPLHTPPPMELFTPNGRSMKSYLHKALPLSSNDLLTSQQLQNRDSTEPQPALSTSSSDSSEAGSSGDGESPSSSSPRQNSFELWNSSEMAGNEGDSSRKWLFSTVGQMRKYVMNHDALTLANPFCSTAKEHAVEQGRDSVDERITGKEPDTVVLRLGPLLMQ